MTPIRTIFSLLALQTIYLVNGQCTDIPPPGNYSCEDQVKWGKCNEPWMSVYCECSCEAETGIIVSIELLAGTAYVSTSTPALGLTTTPTLGFTTGGATGVENFRRSIEEDVLPSPLDLTYEGVFNEYFFDSKNVNDNINNYTCDQLFCPDYSVAVSADPLSEKVQWSLYMSVGLDSGLAVENFSRKCLNIVVLLDISGSMADIFYTETDDDPSKIQNEFVSKLDVAKLAILDMIQQLNSNDSISIILFSDFPEVVIKLSSLEKLDFEEISQEISQVESSGGTNMEAGYKAASDILKNCFECVFNKEYDNRIILVTDAQPNVGDTSVLGLSSQVKNNAGNSIFTTFIGVGLDFNTQLSEILTKTRGANYFVVGSPEEFRKKIDDEFDFMVTPLVFDLKLEIDEESFNNGDGWKVIKAYGSPDVDGGLDKNGTFIETNTLFPSPKTEEGIKGGIILLKLQKPKSDVPLQLKVSYKDRDTLQKFETFSEVGMVDSFADQEFFESSGVQKAVLLARYVDLLRGWLIDQHVFNDQNTNTNTSTVVQNRNSIQSVADLEQQQQQQKSIILSKNLCDYYPSERVIDEDNQCSVKNFVQPKSGILPVFDSIVESNQDSWGASWQPLKVSFAQGEAMQKFLIYLQDTIDDLGDATLEQEVAILIKLVEISGYL